jgi:integrase
LVVAATEGGQKSARRIPLENAHTPAEAKVALEDLKKERRDECLRPVKQAPYFDEFAEVYLSMGKGGKRETTVERERSSIKHWCDFLGRIRLNAITKKHLYAYIKSRKDEGVSNRTVNIELTTMNQLLKKAKEFEHIRVSPMTGIKKLKHVSPRRPLLEMEQIEAICEAAKQHSKNGAEFADYILFMAYTGARRNEALRVRWQDIDRGLCALTIGSDGKTKNHEARLVNFNPNLEALLKDMWERRAPDSVWLFPSPQRGEKDIPSKTFGESLNIARRESGIDLNFHDLRHFFISTCVMAGIDYMTIARWVGHKDGGVLIGKVYGHLSDEHARKAAEGLRF